jgi:hypothetical protein
MHTLTDLCAGMMENDFVNIRLAYEFNLGPAVFLITKREADVFEASGESLTTDDGR